MSSISVDYDVLNQKGSPAWYSDTFANIPTPGYKGRMFISTDTFAFYRDNGTGWDLVGGPGTGTITGAGVSGQVTYFIGTDTIGGNNNLFYDITNSRLGIGTATPGAPLDIHSTGTAAQFNGTGVNNSFVLFQNAGSSKWRIGNLYNSGANDYQIFDVTNSTARLTIKNTGDSTLIGTFTATSLIKSGGTSSQILLADGTTTPTSTFGAGSVTNVSALTLGTTGVDLSSSVANSTTTPVITLNVPTASATNRGALSSADWTTFNNKQSTITLTTTGTSGAATLVGATLNIPNYTNVGTVTSVAALTLGTSGTDLSSSVANSTSTPVITLNVPTASATNRGALSSADFTTFNNKQATISVTAPVVLTGATISMPAATTSVNGYLTSTDWNTFNSKTSNLGTVTDVVALTIGTTGIDITSTAVTTTTTPVITLNIPTASASNRGALSSTDWTTFNNKQATLSLTTTGTSGAATLVANTLNVPNYGSGAVTGSGTNNTISKFTASNTIGNSLIADDGTYVGINGSVSSHIFQIYSSGFNYARVGLTNSSTGNLASDGLIFQQETTNSIIKNQENGYLAFGVNGAETNLVIAQGGNVGVGTASPSEGLTINGAVIRLEGGVGVTPFAIANNNSSGFRIYDYTAAATRFTIATTGAATFSSSVTLSRPSSGATILSLEGSSAYGDTSTINFCDSRSYIKSTILVSANGNTDLSFATYNGSSVAQRLYIADSGAATFSSSITATDLVINTATNQGGAFINGNVDNVWLKINNTATGGQSWNIGATGGTSGLGQGKLIFKVGGTETAFNIPLTLTTDNSTNGGRVGIGTTSPSNLLDIGTPITNALYGFSLSYTGTTVGVYQVNNATGELKFGGAAAGYFPTFYSGGTERYRITSTGINNYTSRGNYLGATDNALFSLNSGGTLYTVGFSPTATASSTNTFTLTTGTTTWIYTGTGTATWTLPNPSGNNQIYWIKNAGTGIITLNAFSGTNIINNAAASVSSITIAVGATAVIAQDGNVKSYQLQ